MANKTDEISNESTVWASVPLAKLITRVESLQNRLLKVLAVMLRDEKYSDLTTSWGALISNVFNTDEMRDVGGNAFGLVLGATWPARNWMKRLDSFRSRRLRQNDRASVLVVNSIDSDSARKIAAGEVSSFDNITLLDRKSGAALVDLKGAPIINDRSTDFLFMPFFVDPVLSLADAPNEGKKRGLAHWSPKEVREQVDSLIKKRAKTGVKDWSKLIHELASDKLKPFTRPEVDLVDIPAESKDLLDGVYDSTANVRLSDVGHAELRELVVNGKHVIVSRLAIAFIRSFKTGTVSNFFLDYRSLLGTSVIDDEVSLRRANAKGARHIVLNSGWIYACLRHSANRASKLKRRPVMADKNSRFGYGDSLTISPYTRVSIAGVGLSRAQLDKAPLHQVAELFGRCAVGEVSAVASGIEFLHALTVGRLPVVHLIDDVTRSDFFNHDLFITNALEVN